MKPMPGYHAYKLYQPALRRCTQCGYEQQKPLKRCPGCNGEVRRIHGRTVPWETVTEKDLLRDVVFVEDHEPPCDCPFDLISIEQLSEF